MADPEPTPDKPVDKSLEPSASTPTVTLPPADGAGPQGDELVRVLDQYLADLDAGRAPPRDRLLADHPELAAQLAPCLSGIEFIHRAGHGGADTPSTLGDFRIVREIGRGGMGVVYEAEQLSLKRRVALKVLRFGAVADPGAMERFQREAETVACLHHTNIVPIFAIGDQQGVSYYAMQFIEGRSLAAVYDAAQKSAAPLDPTEIAQWAVQAADALAHAHARGVIHRDVKPSNLILDPDGRIWLTDFGLAKRVDDMALSMTGALLGTPRYMSPEQASAAKLPVDQRTDVYSLGATLYELATGLPMFDADTPHAVLSAILTAEPQPPRRLRPDLPRDLETIILRCVAKEPGNRYGTAQALADDLRAFTQGWPIKAQRASVIERAVRWVRRRRRSVALVASTAAIAVLAVVGAFASWWGYRQAQLGSLSLATEGPSLSAEIFEADGTPVPAPAFSAPVATLAVPNQEPLQLPQGKYHVRLSASGLLSETWPVDIQRGQSLTAGVRLHSQHLWPPMHLSDEDRPPELVDLAGGTDLITVQRVRREGVDTSIVRRLDGATAKPVWPADLEFNAKTQPAGGDLGEWQRVLFGGPSRGMPELLRPAIDLDGDGVRDLMWASRTATALVAVSGKDGKPLWWFRGTAAPDGAEPFPGSASTVATLGPTAVGDIDGDKTPDMIVAFLSMGESYRAGNTSGNTGPKAWAEAVSGRTGKRLWRRMLWEKPLPTSDPANQRAMPLPLGRWDVDGCVGAPQVAQAGDKLMAMIGLDQNLWRLDAKTGLDVSARQDLGFDLVHTPQVAQFAGDGPQALLLGRKNQSAVVSVVELQTGDTLWLRTLQSFPIVGEPRMSVKKWPVVTDLDGDGRAEVVLPVLDGAGADNYSGVEALDGATGATLWQRRLQRCGMIQPTAIQRLAVGPDLDGDGRREVFVAFSGQDRAGLSSLGVAALSGADGRTLWRWRRPASHSPMEDKAGPIQFWNAGLDGWPMLVVPFENGPGGQAMTFVFSSATGRLLHTLPEVVDPRLADFNGDGVADLLHHQLSTAGSENYGRLTVLRGNLPESWRQLSGWTPASDFNGDGSPDLVSPDGTARSFADGSVLWRLQLASPWGTGFVFPPAPQGDLNGDGTPDVLTLERRPPTPGGNPAIDGPVIVAFSGRDGRRLWTADELPLPNANQHASGPTGSYQYPALDWCDVDRDGSAEVLVEYLDGMGSGAGCTLAVLSGRSGKLLWKTPIVPGLFTAGDPLRRPAWADLDGDGVLDLALWQNDPADPSRGTQQLCAISGRDGRRLWSAVAVRPSPAGLWPPAVADLDGDGIPEVVGMSLAQDAQGRWSGQLVVADSRTGKTRWTWSWNTDMLSTLPPLLIGADSGGPGAVCVCVRENRAASIVVLTHAGQIRERMMLGSEHDLRRAAPCWRTFDPGGDGRKALLFIHDKKLVACCDSLQRPLWQWPLPAGGASVVEIRPGGPSRPATIVMQSGRSVFGLSGLSGRPVWRCETEPGPAAVLWPGDPAATPSVWSQSSFATICRPAWPTDSEGRFRPPAPVAVDYDAQPPQELRRLPWWGDRNSLVMLPMFGILGLALVGGPALAVRFASQRDSFTLGLLAALSAIPAILVWYRDTEFLLGLSALVAAAVPGQLAYWAWRRRSLQLHLLVMAGVAATLGAFLYRYRPSPYGPGPLSRLVAAPIIALTMVAMMAPVAALVAGVVGMIRRWQWARILKLLGASVALSAAIAALALWSDSRWKESTERYAWDGWYMILPIGLYAVGTLWLVAALFADAGRRTKAAWRSRAWLRIAGLAAILLLAALAGLYLVLRLWLSVYSAA